MENELKSLMFKMDQLMEIQKSILKSLNQSTILSNYSIQNIKRTKKKEQGKNKEDEMLLILKNSIRLKKKFNLAVRPQGYRILAYLSTNDSKVFDGLKRNKK